MSSVSELISDSKFSAATVSVGPTDIDNIDTGPLYAVSVHSWATKWGS
jgi:hypothetical protein